MMRKKNRSMKAKKLKCFRRTIINKFIIYSICITVKNKLDLHFKVMVYNSKALLYESDNFLVL